MELDLGRYGNLTILRESHRNKWTIHYLCETGEGKTAVRSREQILRLLRRPSKPPKVKIPKPPKVKIPKPPKVKIPKPPKVKVPKPLRGMKIDLFGPVKSRPPEIHRMICLWRGMWDRCTRPKHTSYKNYGGRGIKVCDEWRDFYVFLSDMGFPPEGYTLDRMNNNEGYSKENCRWVDRYTQSHNKRRQNYACIQARGRGYRVVVRRYGIRHAYTTRSIERAEQMRDLFLTDVLLWSP
jgi:hypothetical protein